MRSKISLAHVHPHLFSSFFILWVNPFMAVLVNQQGFLVTYPYGSRHSQLSSFMTIFSFSYKEAFVAF